MPGPAPYTGHQHRGPGRRAARGAVTIVLMTAAVLAIAPPAVAAGPTLTCEIWPVVNGQAQRDRRRELRVELPDPAVGAASLLMPGPGNGVRVETQLHLGTVSVPMPNGQTTQRALLFDRPAPAAAGQAMVGVSYAAGRLDGGYLNLRTEAGRDDLALSAGEIGGATRMEGSCRR